MKRPLLLCLTGVAFLTLLFLSVAHASPELRDIPQTGGDNGEKHPGLSTQSHNDSLGIERESAYVYGNTYSESFGSLDGRDADNTTASWGGGSLTLPIELPVVLGEYALSDVPTNVAARGDRAYVTVAGGFSIYDISDPADAKFTGAYQLHAPVPAAAQAVAIAPSGEVVYVCAGSGGLEVVDLSDRSQPAVYVTTFRHTVDGDINDAVVEGNYLYLVERPAGVVVLDISNERVPFRVGVGTITGMTDIDVDGDLVMTAGNNQVATFNISMRAAPMLMDTNPVQGVRRVLIRQPMAYATVPRVFGAMDVSNPTDIRHTSPSPPLCDGSGLAFEEYLGDQLYVADGSCGVRLIDVSNPGKVFTLAMVELGTRVRQLTLTGDLLIGVGDAPNRLVVMDRVTTRYAVEEAVATSNTVFSHHRDITDIRVETQQAGSIAWEVSVDDGDHWQSVEGDGRWNKTQYPGGDLRWRATLTADNGVIPVCTRLVISWKFPLLPDRPGAVIRVRLDGTGDVVNLHAARDIALPGDTLVLGDGVFTGRENRGLFFRQSLYVRSENGPEHTIIDGQGDGYVFSFKGDDYNFYLNSVEGIQFVNAGPSPTQGTITADHCFLTVADCIFRDGKHNAIWTELSFANVRDSKFIDCDDGIVGRFSLDVADCLFQGLGFAVWFSAGGVRVQGSTFFDNGTAIYSNYHGGATIEGNAISYNTFGVWFRWANGNIRNNIIDSNDIGIYLEESQALPIAGNLIVRNTRAAMAIEGSAADIVGNTICDNEVRLDALIDLRDFSDVTATHNLIAFNRSGDVFGHYENTRALVTGNNIFESYGDPLLGTIDGGDNQFTNPLFCDREGGQYLLAEDSPCLPDNNPMHVQIGARGVGCRNKDNSTSESPIRSGLISVAPNPFNPATRIRYGVTEPGEVRLAVYDVAGRVVAWLINNEQDPGEREIEWNATAVSSGVYFARLVTPEGAFTQKLVVVK